MTNFDQNDVEKYLIMNEDELYALLVPDHLRRSEHLYSRSGLIARGKEIFNYKLKYIQETICKNYNSYKDMKNDIVALVTLLANAFSNEPQFAGIPVIPIAVLITKIGLDKICKEGIKRAI